mmetsp:Transcript_16870/g.27371  ORF Transcript_16870/g.27371 Transcript_16870/m.27371 type:complete len:260 (-) Transcript_16870:1414-2193(-)
MTTVFFILLLPLMHFACLSFFHFILHRVVFVTGSLLLVNTTSFLIDTRAKAWRFATEGDVHRAKELVESFHHTNSRTSGTRDAWRTFVNDDAIGHRRCHDKVVLYQKKCFSEMIHHPTFHNLRGDDTLFTIQPCTRFIKEIKLCSFSQAESNGQALHLTTTQTGYRKVSELVHLEGLQNQQAKKTIRERSIDPLLEETMHRTRKPTERRMQPLSFVSNTTRSQVRMVCCLVFQAACQHFHIGRLPRTILAHESHALSLS